MSYAALLAVFANVVVAPVLLFAPFTGAWVDRHNLKHVLVVSDALRALIVLAMPILFQLTHSTDVVFALVFLLFTVNVVFLPAKSAMVPGDRAQPISCWRRIRCSRAPAFSQRRSARCAGGYIIDRWGWAFAMRLDAASYLISVIGLALVTYRASDHHARLVPISVRGYLDEVGTGLGARAP